MTRLMQPLALPICHHCFPEPQKVKATFLLSGWVDSSDGAPARHVVRVVEGQQV